MPIRQVYDYTPSDYTITVVCCGVNLTVEPGSDDSRDGMIILVDSATCSRCGTQFSLTSHKPAKETE